MGIRMAMERDLPMLRDIEQVAGDWAAVGMREVDEDDPPSVEELRTYQVDGRAWVWVDNDAPVAYLIADWVDDSVHVEQVSVHPDAAGRGLGRQLLRHVEDWARERGATALSLTTFTEVPWNGPYYQRLGFHVVSPDQLTDGLRRIRADEAARGLDRWPRAVMRKDL